MPYILLSFVQIGFSYYLSVALALLIVMVVKYRRELLSGLISRPLMWLAVLLIFVPTIVAQGQQFSTNLLLACRQALMLLLMVSFIAGLERNPMRPARDLRPGRILIWASLMLALVTLQSVLLAGGNSFVQFPAEWYVMNSGTLVTELSLKYSQGNLRPAGTFGEPSYLAFVTLGLALGIAPLARSRAARMALIILLLVGLLSRSMAFVISASLVLLLPLLLGRDRNKGVLFLAAAIAVPVFAFTKAGAVLERLGAAGISGADTSASARIWAPLYALPRYLFDHPIGMPIRMLESVLPDYWPVWLPYEQGGLNNAFFNMFYEYGLLSIPVLVVVFTATRYWQMRVFLLCVMMFNGAFFSIDKTAIVALVSAGYVAAKWLNGQALRPKPAAAPAGDEFSGGRR